MNTVVRQARLVLITHTDDGLDHHSLLTAGHSGLGQNGNKDDNSLNQNSQMEVRVALVLGTFQQDSNARLLVCPVADRICLVTGVALTPIWDCGSRLLHYIRTGPQAQVEGMGSHDRTMRQRRKDARTISIPIPRRLALRRSTSW